MSDALDALTSGLPVYAITKDVVETVAKACGADADDAHALGIAVGIGASIGTAISVGCPDAAPFTRGTWALSGERVATGAAAPLRPDAMARHAMRAGSPGAGLPAGRLTSSGRRLRIEVG